MQGFNMGRYHAPSSLDAALGAPPAKRARTARAVGGAAAAAPAPTVRFEMPFAVWCGTCAPSSTSCLIGQGVRFNAQKRRVGSYFSTPVWQFRMKHTACGGWIEIRTDPRTSEYLVTEGGRRRETGGDEAVAERIGGVVVGLEDAEKERRRQGVFAAFEGKQADKAQAVRDVRRIEQLQSLKQRDWGDVDAANRRLRATFRVGRRERERDAASGERLKDALGLDIDLLPEHEADVQRAALIDYGGVASSELSLAEGGASSVAAKPLFAASPRDTKPSAGGGKRTKSSVNKPLAAPARLRVLQSELVGNTRAAVDHFAGNSPAISLAPLPGLKRRPPKKPIESAMARESPKIHEISQQGNDDNFTTPDTTATTLVDYESD